MIGAYYDIEVFSNYVSLLFLDMQCEQRLIDEYINADIAKNEDRKLEALSHIPYRLFILHEDQYDANEFYEFISGIKLLIGFNSIKFDNLIVDFLFLKKDIVINPETHWWAIQRIKMLVDTIIENNNVNYKFIDEELKQFNEPYTSIDLYMALFETVARKSLKQSAINIKWYRIEDLPLKPNSVVKSSDFRKIFDYNMNDVLITRALHLKKKEEFELRIDITAKYNVNVLTSNRSTIADKLMGRFYSQYTGLKYFQFKDKRTTRTVINFGDVINPRINFITPELQQIYSEIRNTNFYVEKE